MGSKEDDERVLVEALWRAGKGGNGEGVDYGKVLRGLHGVRYSFCVFSCGAG